MDKYQEFLEGKQGEAALMELMLKQVYDGTPELAKETAARIMAIRDIKFEMLKLDRNGN